MTNREKELFKMCLEVVLNEKSSEESIRDAKIYLEIFKDRI